MPDQTTTANDLHPDLNHQGAPRSAVAYLTMTTSTLQRSHGDRPLLVGIKSGGAFAVLFSSWPLVSMVASGWMLWADAKKRQTQLSETDRLRMAAGWFLAAIFCNLLMNWDSFQTGLIAGWQAAP
jgi:hypothetical protein